MICPQSAACEENVRERVFDEGVTIIGQLSVRYTLHG